MEFGKPLQHESDYDAALERITVLMDDLSGPEGQIEDDQHPAVSNSTPWWIWFKPTNPFTILSSSPAPPPPQSVRALFDRRGGRAGRR